jgi:Integron cassette protein VCH_CASS1 chain
MESLSHIDSEGAEMAITANDVETLHRYAEGVMDRAEHHAGQVKGAALALLGGIIWRGEPGSIEIKQYGGGLANVLWVTIGGRRYAFAYNHTTESIEIRDRTQSGPALHSFNNQTPLADIEAVFRAL